MLPKWFPNKVAPNEGNYVGVQIDAVNRLISTVVIYVHSDENQYSKGSFFDVVNENNKTVYRVYFRKFNSLFPLINKVVNFYRYFKAQLSAYQKLKSKRGVPRLVHVHVLTRTTVFALYLKIKEEIPFIISEHWSGFLIDRIKQIPLLKKLLIRVVCKKASSITCVSEAVKEGLYRITHCSDIRVIYNAIDTTIFNIRPSGLSQKSRKRILHISRLDSHPKNFPGILSVMKALSESDFNCELNVIGDGIERMKQENLAQSYGLLNNTVFFHGYLSPMDVSDWMNQSDFLLVFSNYESQSKVILEAFSCGIPVIATEVGGIPELVNADRGILISPKDERALTNAIIKMSSQLGRYEPKELRSFSVDSSSLNVIGKKFLMVYKEVNNCV